MVKYNGGFKYIEDLEGIQTDRVGEKKIYKAEYSG